MTEPLYGLVEAGGTKFVLGVATASGRLVAEHRIPTTDSAETLQAMVNWFENQPAVAAFGVASFGPIEIHRASPGWGRILKTPKAGWSGVDILGPLSKRFDLPVALDTDVNAAALAEYRWGSGQGKRSVLYFTVGTGIGGGAVIDGKCLNGIGHPEMGHIPMPRHPDDLEFAGCCPFHADCLEGLASGSAIKARWDKSLSELGLLHPANDIVAWYLAQLVINLQAIFEPDRIIFGGGVMQVPGLLDRIAKLADELGANYFRGRASEIIGPPGLGTKVGLMGALALAVPSPH